MNVHQYHQTLLAVDAIGYEMQSLRAIFRGWGMDSRCFCEERGPDVPASTTPASEMFEHASPSDILIIHYGVWHDGFTRALEWPGPKILRYHNVTPSRFFLKHMRSAQVATELGRSRLEYFRDRVQLALCVSEFNKQDLDELGFTNAAVLPLLVNFPSYAGKKDPALMKKMSDGKTNLLFVGRVSPNKKQEDLIRLYRCYRELNPKSRMIIVGCSDPDGTYMGYLRRLKWGLGLKGVILTDFVHQPQLLAYYATADVYVSMSEHEGFSSPLLEAMYYGIPVVAYAAGAVPWTLGGSGVTFDEKNFDMVAGMIDLLVRDESLRSRIVRRQKERVKDFFRDRIERQLADYIDNVISR